MDPTLDISLTKRPGFPIEFDLEDQTFWVTPDGKAKLLALHGKFMEFGAWVIETTGDHAANLASFSKLYPIASQKGKDLGIASMLTPAALTQLLRKHSSEPLFDMIGGFDLVEGLIIHLALPENSEQLNKFQEYLRFFATGWRKVSADN